MIGHGGRAKAAWSPRKTAETAAPPPIETNESTEITVPRRRDTRTERKPGN